MIAMVLTNGWSSVASLTLSSLFLYLYFSSSSRVLQRRFSLCDARYLFCRSVMDDYSGKFSAETDQVFDNKTLNK